MITMCSSHKVPYSVLKISRCTTTAILSLDIFAVVVLSFYIIIHFLFILVALLVYIHSCSQKHCNVILKLDYIKT